MQMGGVCMRRHERHTTQKYRELNTNKCVKFVYGLDCLLSIILAKDVKQKNVEKKVENENSDEETD